MFCKSFHQIQQLLPSPIILLPFIFSYYLLAKTLYHVLFLFESIMQFHLSNSTKLNAFKFLIPDPSSLLSRYTLPFHSINFSRILTPAHKNFLKKDSSLRIINDGALKKERIKTSNAYKIDFRRTICPSKSVYCSIKKSLPNRIHNWFPRSYGILSICMVDVTPQIIR